MVTLLFITGYGAAIWAGFLIFVLCMLPGHSYPGMFAGVFLTLWPLLTTCFGLESLLAVGKDSKPVLEAALTGRKLHGDKIFLRGLYAGIATAITCALLGVLAWLTTPWVAILPLLLILVAPGIGFVYTTRATVAALQVAQMAGSSGDPAQKVS